MTSSSYAYLHNANKNLRDRQDELMIHHELLKNENEKLLAISLHNMKESRTNEDELNVEIKFLKNENKELLRLSLQGLTESRTFEKDLKDENKVLMDKWQSLIKTTAVLKTRLQLLVDSMITPSTPPPSLISNSDSDYAESGSSNTSSSDMESINADIRGGSDSDDSDDSYDSDQSEQSTYRGFHGVC
jgi:hypothetical protein